jgi:hypothetical protein
MSDSGVIDWDSTEDLDIPDEYLTNVKNSMPSGTELFEAFLKKYKNDPLAFAIEVLELGEGQKEALMPHQFDILDRIGQGLRGELPLVRRLALRSGHRVGKTRLLAILTVWFFVTRYPQKTIVTAPTAGQLEGGLWPEIKVLSRRLPGFMYELFDFMSEEIRLKADPDGSFTVARTASPENAESFQGQHSENILFIWDEAAGIDERLYNAARGSMGAANAMTVLAGNPTRLNNYFHKAFTTNASIWTRFRISSIGLKTMVPDFINEIIQTFGENSNEYRVRVLGEFPDTEDASFISAAAVRNAMEREISVPPMSAVVYGVDPARFGDDRTVITKRRGTFNIEKQIVLNKADTMQVVGRIVQEASLDRDRLVAEFKEHGRPLLYLPPVPAQIVVDVIGLGAGVVDRLKELGYDVMAANAAEKAVSDVNCVRERDAIWKRGKAWLENGKCAIAKDAELQTELTAPFYAYTSAGELQIESKKEMKKRGMRSPDKADSALLTLIVDPTIFTEFAKGGADGQKSLGYGSGPRGALKRRR